MSLQLENVSHSYGSQTILHDLSLTIETGSLTALLGPSGSGKSTMLRILGGLERPDAGRVLSHGRDVTAVDARFRGVGYCFQSYAPFRHMTVAKNIAYGLRVRRRPRAEIAQRVEELLALVRLEGKGGRYPSQLSGGERQRMALARALAIEPDVLLLDEPFGALDAKVRDELRQWLRNLHSRMPVTTVLVTHDQHEAMEVADSLVILDGGHIQQVGEPLACYDRPANDFVQGFLGPLTTFKGRAVRPHQLTAGEVGTPSRVVELTHFGHEIRVDLVDDEGNAFWLAAPRSDLDVTHLRPGSPLYVSLR